MEIYKPTEKKVEKFKFLIEELKENVLKAEELIRKGLLEKKIRKRLKFNEIKVNFMNNKLKIDKKEIIDLAKGLIYVKKKKRVNNFFFVKREDAPFIFDFKTAELRANYLKELLNGKVFADLSCGYGVQSFEFLNFTKEALFVDKNIKTLFYTFLNSVINNKWQKISFLNADSEKLPKEIIDKIKKMDFIYSESFRKKGVKEINLLKPNPNILVKYNKKAIFDVSPLIEDINFKNYELSTIEDKKGINRLSIYLNLPVKRHYIVEEELKIVEGSKRNTIILPFEEISFKKGFKFGEFYKSAVKLKMVKEAFIYNKNYFTISFEEKEHIKKIFEVYEILEFEEIKKQKDSEVKAILRFNVNPKEYYKIKEKIENLLSSKGFKGKFYVFKLNKKLLVAKEAE